MSKTAEHLNADDLRQHLSTPAGRAAFRESGVLRIALQDPELRPVLLAALRRQREATEQERRRVAAHRYVMAPPYPLLPEPTPRQVAADGLRHRVTPPTWVTVRSLVLTEWQQQCAVCRSGGPLAVVSRWSYDDVAGFVTLDRLLPLCLACHAVYRYAGWPRSPDEYDAIIAHLCRVDHVPDGGARQIVADALAQYDQRKRRPWSVDLASWPNLVDAVGGQWLPGRAPEPVDSDLLDTKGFTR